MHARYAHIAGTVLLCIPGSFIVACVIYAMLFTGY